MIWERIKRLLGLDLRKRVREVEGRVSRTEGAMAAFAQLAKDIRRD